MTDAGGVLLAVLATLGGWLVLPSLAALPLAWALAVDYETAWCLAYAVQTAALAAAP